MTGTLPQSVSRSPPCVSPSSSFFFYLNWATSAQPVISAPMARAVVPLPGSILPPWHRSWFPECAAEPAPVEVVIPDSAAPEAVVTGSPVQGVVVESSIPCDCCPPFSQSFPPSPRMPSGTSPPDSLSLPIPHRRVSSSTRPKGWGIRVSGQPVCVRPSRRAMPFLEKA